MSLLLLPCLLFECVHLPQRVALVDQEADGGDLLLDAPDAPGLAPQDLLLEAVGHRLVELPYLIQVPQSRPVWNGNNAMRRFQSGFKRHSHQL